LVLGFLVDLGFLRARGRGPATKEGRLRACGHGVVKLTLVRVVCIVERKRRRGDGEV